MTPSTAPRVTVLAGGLSHERDVSLRSGRRVAEALRETGCEVTIRDVDAALLPSLREDPPDVVWPLLHGAGGEDGALADVVDLLGIRRVGSPSAASRTSWDKPVAASVLAAAGIATPESIALPHGTFRELGAAAVLDAVVDRIGLPLVVKPARGGSALGVTHVADPAGLPRAMVDCFAYGEVALLQQWIGGTEVGVSVVEDHGAPRALPPVEVVPDSGLYDYDARYTAGATEFFVPARLDEATTTAAVDAAITAHRALGLRGLSRTDLIVDTGGRPWFLEVNTAPGQTETSLFPMAARGGGEDLPQLYRRLVDRVAGRS